MVDGSGADFPLSRQASEATRQLRELIALKREDIDLLLVRYAATNPRLFGSVARGDASLDSDIDILVDMDPSEGNILLRAAGLMEEMRELFPGIDIDIFPTQLLRRGISEAAIKEAQPLWLLVGCPR
ncbi:MAG: nucleotidyltransferase domain-containing protein [Actinomycetaceae bacterium]|nr:nucleotidyltransferase domain-containing protein [Actinomycetaceae bacterium]